MVRFPNIFMHPLCCCSVRTIVLGVGNPLCGDDAVGLHVAALLRQRIRDPDVVIEESMTGGLPLVERLVGYDRAIIIDSLQNSEAAEGEVRRLTVDAFAATSASHPHGIDFGTALAHLRKVGAAVPTIVVIGITIGECQLAEHLSPAVSAAVPRAADAVLRELNREE